MGRYDSSDDDYERRKKKKSRRSSRSRSRSSDYRSSRKSKHKKSSSRSRRHRSRSRSRDGYRFYSRRSRSYSRERYRSHSGGRRRSRERSYDDRRSSSGSPSGSRYRSRRSRSSSRGRRKGSPSYSSREHSASRSGTEGITKSFADMTPTEQNQARMQLAIEKAKAADEAIRQRHRIDEDEPVDTKKRQRAIDDIESENFSQSTFTSSRLSTNETKKKEPEFFFGTSLDFIKSNNSRVSTDPDSLMHERFSEDESLRKTRWLEKLKQLRIDFVAS